MVISNEEKRVTNGIDEQVGLFDLFPIMASVNTEQMEITDTNDLVGDEQGEQEEQIVDPRNSLNDLTGKQWLPETKSFFFQKGLGANHPHAQIERKHPAPYSFQDISRLVLFFTKKGDMVLDPFGGIGSTAKACALNNRLCTSIELSPEWHNLSLERLETEVANGSSLKHAFINDDCIPVLKTFEDETFDFMVTSPPYWAILNKKADHKVKKGRVEQNLATNYSNKDNDLGNIESYEKFLDTLVNDVFKECGRVLKEKKYMCIVVSDFRNKSEFISFHSDLIQRLSHMDVGAVVNWYYKVSRSSHKTIKAYCLTVTPLRMWKTSIISISLFFEELERVSKGSLWNLTVF